MSKYHTPIHVIVYDDLVAFLVPKLRETVGDMLTLINAGHDHEQVSRWSLYTFEGEQHALVLQVTHGHLSFNLSLGPIMWENLPAIQKARTIGIITERKYWDAENGDVTAMILGDDGQVVQTMYKVYNVNNGLKVLPETLKEIRQTWNPKGVLTYLLHILGEPLEAEAL